MRFNELYHEINGDYDSAISLLRKEERIEKYLLKYLENEDFKKLENAVTNCNIKEVFLYSHSLKGFAGNLGMTGLFKASSVICEATRDNESVSKTDLNNMLELVKSEHDKVIEAIKKYK